MLEIFTYGFIQRALFTGISVGTACALLGVFLVLRRYALIGHGLTHVAFGGVAVGLLFFRQPFWATLIVTLLSSMGILKMQQKVKIYADVAIGIVSAVGMAVGVVIAGVGGGFNVDLMSYLFGSILTIGDTEFIVSIVISALVICFIVLFYHDLFAMTFDEESARAMGIGVDRYNYFFAAVSAFVVVVGMRVVGLLLVSALMILPAVTSLQLSRTFRTSLVISASAAVLSVIAGLLISFFLDLPTGGTIVLFNFLLFLLAFSIKKLFLEKLDS